jgi:hypothetical protein
LPRENFDENNPDAPTDNIKFCDLKAVCSPPEEDEAQDEAVQQNRRMLFNNHYHPDKVGSTEQIRVDLDCPCSGCISWKAITPSQLAERNPYYDTGALVLTEEQQNGGMVTAETCNFAYDLIVDD